MKKVIFSGIQPSGNIHIGNYLGAIKQWAELQNEADSAVFCIVDMHAITVPQSREDLQANIYSLCAIYLASGLDPEKSILFLQSDRPEHSQLAWILNCYTGMGELSRMTQYKDKSGDERKFSSVGLFDYPVLMASDILLYHANTVPVGDDQKQHVELTRDIAERFNSKFGEIFTLPEPLIKKTGSRIMGLDDPAKKMSKSASSVNNYILLNDDPDIIKQKIMRAVTDSGSDIKAGTDKPAMTNLLNIYSEISGRTTTELEAEFSTKGYGEFKQILADELIAYLSPIREDINKYLSDKAELEKILKAGSAKAQKIASTTLDNVKEKIGLGLYG